MDVLIKIKQFLSKPFPQEESVFETLRIAASISVFVVFFLYVFKPFGIHQLASNQFLICLGFGITTFSASLVYEFATVRILKWKGSGANFTFGRWIIYFLGVMLFISLANFLFVRITLFDDIQWVLFPYMIRGTFAIGIFPIIFVGAIALLRQERKYQNIADEINHKEKPPAKKKQLDEPCFYGIPASRIRYIEAMQNYIKIGHIADDGYVKEQTERATLKSITNDALGESFSRCHRSFVVNRQAIIATSGNAQGLLLALANCDKKIPVSRSFIKIFRDT